MLLQTLRIIDCNCNRVGEGLRFLEDIARFTLDDSILSHQLKMMRHDLVTHLSKLGIDLLSERDADKDVGADIESPSNQQDFPSLIRANAKRVEEALRVLEELSKLPEISPILESSEFKRARFNLYTLERELLSKILRQQKMKKIAGLYLILDTQILMGKDEVNAARQAISGGIKVIQLRDKYYKKAKLLAIAQKLKDLCCKSGTIFIINDHLDIALAVNADGLHVGQDDLPLSVVRTELPIDKIVGCSTNKLEQALKAEAEGADYIAVGSIFPSPTKKDAVVVGLERLRQIKQASSVPLVAIGGINNSNIAEAITAGADSVAVISAVLSQDNIEEATRQLIKEIEKKSE